MIKLGLIILLAVFAAFTAADEENVRNEWDPSQITSAQVVRQKREDWLAEFPPETFDNLVSNYQALVQNRVYQSLNPPPNTPFMTIITKGLYNFPVYIRARIAHGHLKPSTDRTAIPQRIYRHLRDNFGKEPRGDEAGHLLAYALGGGMNNDFNYVPQTSILNRNVGQSYSLWWEIERDIKVFLEENERGHVDWEIIVVYSSDARIKRPIGFRVRYQFFKNQVRAVGNLVEWCFSNKLKDELTLAFADCVFPQQGK